eukprot:CAMPEP_0170651674 /NCGR_PEP_ID=MMETSP0224-20130122/46495_1 /TAXON_ID=285029 /ORGANISM="Togula jolla, Strain CCCM 725" /LENGTH=76 /DNA_ID=CAMNT_0010983485 /DNA_START=243 /DNA_END=469 /DNA_ORIENTATION=-
MIGRSAGTSARECQAHGRPCPDVGPIVGMLFSQLIPLLPAATSLNGEHRGLREGFQSPLPVYVGEQGNRPLVKRGL